MALGNDKLRRRSPKMLLFDVFGTVVDWRESVAHAASRVGRAHRVQADWHAFADRWRAGYRPAMDRVRRGEWPWQNIDTLHRRILDAMLPDFWLDDLDDTARHALVLAWHRLAPWPDARAGLRRLKRGYVIATLSNGNVALLTDLAKHAGLPWDCVLSAELFGHYKPDPEVYLGAVRLLQVDPADAMMVAAHKDDLRAAAACGLQTAFVARPHEFGPKGRSESRPERAFDVNARDLLELADRLESRGPR